MPKISTKENKNIYLTTRESLGLSREQASALTGIASDRLGEIELDKAKKGATPYEIKRMSEEYKCPALCNHYCAHECAIGQIYVPEIKTKPLAQIALEILVTFSKISTVKDRLAEILADGEIDDNEKEDFKSIQAKLDEMSLSIDTLRLWVNEAIANGKIDSDLHK